MPQLDMHWSQCASVLYTVCTNGELAIPAGHEDFHVNVSAYTFERIFMVISFHIKYISIKL